MSHLWPVLPALPEWVPRLSPLTVSRWVPLSTWPSIAQAAQSRPSRWGCQARVQHDSSPPCTRVPPEHACTLHARTCAHMSSHWPGSSTCLGQSHTLPTASGIVVTRSTRVGEELGTFHSAHPAHVSLPQVCACPHLVYTVPTSAVYTGVHVQPCEHSLTCVYLFF